ncbi:Serine/threonine-protein phosphatase 1 [Posidoniimonas corsicana]|uniref:Serine/threonine-protein phosphatase 1 n=1 Tax=Posidoniimonas corsicana TaxID=1938618 RepID=A0A5C5V659_9BACT|nr:metallophosphoesterase family protein [Posidoniimonas corsicana]TWT33560.1 Serine/threonine-protein phosphatase 1 [Posidoniimonas corsicana]
MSGRLLAIGDVHGCQRALESLLDQIGLTAEDTLVFLGDLVDRGPSSNGVVDCVCELREEHNVVVIMGNHEEMMRDAISGRGLYNAWLDVGGRETIRSYGGDADAIPPSHSRLLFSSAHYFEADRDVFVHASLEPGVSLPNQSSDYLRWKHLSGSEQPHLSGKRVVCGHTAQRDGVPLVLDGWVCIDTYAHGGQWLSCLDADANHVYQASEKGEVRDFSLLKYS